MKDQRDIFVFNAVVAQRVLLWFTLLWVGINGVFYYRILLHRPKELFSPLNAFGELFSGTFPPVYLYGSVLMVALLCGITCLFYNLTTAYNVVVKSIFLFALVWLNNVRWSYGYASHVGHFLLLTHLFALFMPSNAGHYNGIRRYKTFSYYYGGLLLTYSFSAAWKVMTIFQDIAAGDVEHSWLNRDAALNTAIAGHIWMDEEISTFKQFLFRFPVFWQVMFCLTCLGMLLAPLSVLRYRYFVPVIAGLILFHIHNAVMIRAEFFVTPLVLLIFIIPYHLLLKEGFDEYKRDG